jgi:hypothetical protein
LDTQTIPKFATRRIAQNRHDLIVIVSLGFHGSAIYVARMDEPAMRFIGSIAMILLF